MLVTRYFLELSVINKKLTTTKLPNNFSFEKQKNPDLNKFFYKTIGKDFFWRDRLSWQITEWEKYVSNPNLHTWVLKDQQSYVGFYEFINDATKTMCDIIQLGLLEEYRGKKLGTQLLEHCLTQCLKFKPKKISVHTCSLDHENALKNYLKRGFQLTKKESIQYYPN